MIIPVPAPGLVIRFRFLWSREALAGETEGRKDRPCAIMLATSVGATGGKRVAVVPVTHSPPVDGRLSIALPPAVKRDLGLDADDSWVRLNELNTFEWPGYDLQPIAGTDRTAYGFLPRPLFERIRQGVLALHRERKTAITTRD